MLGHWGWGSDWGVGTLGLGLNGGVGTWGLGVGLGHWGWDFGFGQLELGGRDIGVGIYGSGCRDWG